MNGNFNVTRRPRRSYETYHRDKRRKDVDRLAILEAGKRPKPLPWYKALFAKWFGRAPAKPEDPGNPG